jgi:hypothetical protein
MRCISDILEYGNFEIVFKPGKENIVPDFLSRIYLDESNFQTVNLIPAELGIEPQRLSSNYC